MINFQFSIAEKINVTIQNDYSDNSFNKFIELAFEKFNSPIIKPQYTLHLNVTDNKLTAPTSFRLGNDLVKFKDGIKFNSGHAYYRDGNSFKIEIPKKVKRGRIPWERRTPGRHLVDEILEPFLQIILLSEGLTFLHASCIKEKDGAKVLMGWRHSGKTQTILPKLNDCIIWSDDFIILSKEGTVFPYPRPIRIYTYNLPFLPINKKTLFFLKLKSLITPPWQPVKYWALNKPTETKIDLAEIKPLNKTDLSLPEFADLIMRFEHGFFKENTLFINQFLIKNDINTANIVKMAIERIKK